MRRSELRHGSSSLVEAGERLRVVQRSADFAVVELAGNRSDPLALAYLLWVVRRWDLTLANGDTLANWGEGWIRELLSERRVGRRADEEIASAALAAVAVYGDRDPLAMPDDLRRRLDSFLESELAKDVPLGQPSYAAILLLAAMVFGSQIQGVDAALERVRQAFLGWIPNGRLFGLSILACALFRANRATAVSELREISLQALRNPQAGYENEVYLAEVLCVLETTSADVDSWYAGVTQIVAKSPAWNHLLVGQEDLPQIGDPRSVVRVSHLFRAALLDIAVCVERWRESYTEKQLDDRYRGERIVTTSAFLFFAVVTASAWWLFFEVMRAHGDVAERFWILQHYDSRLALEAVGILLGALVGSYALPASVMSLWIFGHLLLGASSASQARILDSLLPALWTWTRFWVVAVLLALAAGVVATVIAPGIVHLLG